MACITRHCDRQRHQSRNQGRHQNPTLCQLVGADAGYVLTLSTRPDRLQRFQSRGFGSDIHVLVQVPHVRGSIEGCFEAHKQAWADAEARGAGPTLIMEDDATWTAAGLNDATRKKACVAVRDVQLKHPTWDLIALGGTPLSWFTGAAPSKVDGVWEVTFLEAHAYLISPSFRRRMLLESYEGIGLDAFYARQASRSFVVVPELLQQDFSCGSNNGMNIVANALRKPFKRAQVRVARAVRATCGNIPPYYVSTFLLVALAFSIGWFRGKATLPLLLAFFVLGAFHYVSMGVDPALNKSHYQYQ